VTRTPRSRPFLAEVRAYWAQEARSIRSSLSALTFGLAATLVAGVVLATSGDGFAAVPGLLALVPAAIGMRGSIFGALGSRLATSILTGEFRPELRRGTFLAHQVEATVVLSFASAAQAGALAWAVSNLFGLPTIGVLDLVAVSLIGGTLAAVVLFVLVVVMARRSESRGWSMDDVIAPSITAVGDLVTLPAMLIGATVLVLPRTATVVGAVSVVVGIVLAALGVRHRDPTVRRVVRESLGVLTVAVTIDVVAGVALETRIETVFSAAALLVLLPPFIANSGSLGGMLASRLASKLHVGTLTARRFPDRAALLDFTLTGLLAAVAFTGVGAVGWLAAVLVPAVEPLPFVTTIGVALLAGGLALPILALVAYTAASVSFRHGLDPDNHGIPIVTATMDLAGVLCLVAAIVLMQVGVT
jgi:mgtE-like transporter